MYFHVTSRARYKEPEPEIFPNVDDIEFRKEHASELSRTIALPDLVTTKQLMGTVKFGSVTSSEGETNDSVSIMF